MLTQPVEHIVDHSPDCLGGISFTFKFGGKCITQFHMKTIIHIMNADISKKLSIL
ncbi:hypothetical protein D3C75_1385770 [compost metagenome]